MSQYPIHSELINEISCALSKAQGEIKSAGKDSNNPHFKAKFASLHSHWDSCREVLNKNGLMVTQLTTIEESGKPLMVTILSHTSGQWFKSYLHLNPVKNDPQGMGSCITYARRYMLSAIVGTTVDDDDDGETAMNHHLKKEPEKKQETLISQEQCQELQNIFVNCDPKFLNAFWEFNKKLDITSLEKIPLHRFEEYKKRALMNRDQFMSQENETTE